MVQQPVHPRLLHNRVAGTYARNAEVLRHALDQRHIVEPLRQTNEGRQAVARATGTGNCAICKVDEAFVDDDRPEVGQPGEYPSQIIVWNQIAVRVVWRDQHRRVRATAQNRLHVPFGVERKVVFHIQLEPGYTVPWAREFVVGRESRDVDVDMRREVVNDRLDRFGRSVGDKDATGLHPDG